MTTNKTASGTTYVVLCELMGASGEVRVGKARITVFEPNEPSKTKGGDGNPMATFAPRKSLYMDILLFDHIERGWLDYIVREEDIPVDELNVPYWTEALILEKVNTHLSSHNYPWTVKGEC